MERDKERGVEKESSGTEIGQFMLGLAMSGRVRVNVSYEWEA